MSDLVNKVAEILNAPVDLVQRSAEARAAASGISVDDVLSSWAGGESVAASVPNEEASIEEAPVEEPTIEEVVETLLKFKKEGKITQFGFSEISPVSLEKANKIHHVGAIQSEYSLSTRFPELGLLQKTKQLETAFVAFSPVGRGLLTDKPPSPERVKESPFLSINPRFQEPNLSENIKAVKGFQKLARDYQLSTAGLAIAWLLAKDEHIIPIPGTRSTTHLKEMIKGAEKKLSQSDLLAIEKTIPVGWAHGDRYSDIQWIGPEKYC